ncbi:MAG TPA: copper chaperone PCu(A)C [Patescibacteria group bacterium]|nr:copper chaperone PCu(A)C [Patescibacteria group bacterium]
MMLKTLVSAIALFGCVATAQAAEVKAGSLTIETPWARASAGANSAAFMTIKNDGDTPERLLTTKSDAAKDVQLHSSFKDGEVMKMRPVDGIDVPAHGSIELKPGGYHIMLMGLAAPLKDGESFPLTLGFQHAGEVKVTVAVQTIAAMGAAMHEHMQGDMSNMHQQMQMQMQPPK